MRLAAERDKSMANTGETFETGKPREVLNSAKGAISVLQHITILEKGGRKSGLADCRGSC